LTDKETTVSSFKSRSTHTGNRENFGDESFQAISCTGTDNHTQIKREKTHKQTANHKTKNWP